METRASCGSDFMYIKSALDYYYCERSYTLTKIFATNKSSLIKCEGKIRKSISKYCGESVVVICADYDCNDSILNKSIEEYCARNNYELVWMNVDVEDVFLNRTVPKRCKEREAVNFLKTKLTVLSKLNTLCIENPIDKRPASNLLCVFDKYLKRKT